ncbi:MAG: carboxypeptidase regulatory-like domain-containing protein [Bryobacterales bacterium]|nr:carboxypeptidase regulatory-like domain-containing protein [Bryobacterales bacterium]
MERFLQLRSGFKTAAAAAGEDREFAAGWRVSRWFDLVRPTADWRECAAGWGLRRPIALIVSLGFGIAFGQGPSATGSVTGKVVDAATKTGIRKATVHATIRRPTQDLAGGAQFYPATTYSTVTDDGGAYRFAGLPPGPIDLQADKAGHLPRLAQRRGQTVVRAGEETAAEEMLLVKQAIIAGRVTDLDGEPLERVSVIAIPSRRTQAAGLGMGGQAMTDDRGEFRIPRLAGGSYKLLAAKQGNDFTIATTAVPGEPVMINAPTYFPSVLEQASASGIIVGSGEERTGVEIRLQRTAVVKVMGRVSGELGSPSVMVNVALQQVGTAIPGTLRAAMSSGNVMAGPDGRFVFPNVIPGEYLATANAQRGAPIQMLSGMTRVRVGRQDVDQLVVPLLPLAKVTGRAVAEDGGKLPYPQVNIGFAPTETGLRGGGGGPVKPDGTFQMEHLQRIRMKLNSIAPRGWYLKAVAVGGQREPGLEFDLTAGDSAIELIYSNKPGTVEVTVEGLTAESGSNVAVALPDGGNGAPPLTNLYKSVAVSAGRNVFKIEDVPPGNYQIALGPLAVLDTLSDPATWEKLKGKAVAVKVEEGVTVPAAPRLIVESDVEEK